MNTTDSFQIRTIFFDSMNLIKIPHFHAHRIWLRLLLTGILVLFPFLLNAQTEDTEQRIRDCFYRYRDAIMQSDADAAFKEINQNTRDYYADMLDRIWYADADEIGEMTVIEKVFIAQSRHRIPVEELKLFNEESYFKYAVEEGWIGRETVASIELLNVAVNGENAMTTFARDGRALPFGFSFSLEEGDWKIDLVSIIPVSNMGLEHAINNSEFDEEEFVFKVVESLSGTPVTQQIWTPPLARQ